MATVIEVKKSKPTIEAVTLKFNAEELAFLETALEVAYKAHKPSGFSTYVAPVARNLWVTLDAARKGTSSAVTASDIYARPF